MDQLLYVFLLMLPGHIANGTPPLITKISWFKNWLHPIDNGLHLYQTPLLGTHKTWLGLGASIFVGSVVSVLISDFNFFTYPFDPLLFGGMSGFWAILGDALKSFAKRRVGVTSGKPWIPFDQIDYCIPLILWLFSLKQISVSDGFLIVIQSFLLSIIVSTIGWQLKLKERWF